MLNRRFLRVKVMQALYARHQGEGTDLALEEKALFKSVQQAYDLYLYLLYLIPEIVHIARLTQEQNKDKKLPTADDLNPNTRFVDNPIVRLIEDNEVFKRLIENKKINWQNEHELPRKIFKAIRDSELYEKYMNSPDPTFQIHRNFFKNIFESFIATDDLVHYLMEEKNIHWYGDIAVAAYGVIRTLESLKPDQHAGSGILLGLYKDEEEDADFVKELFRKTIANDARFEAMIKSKIENWELERTAVLDLILMKMALTEFIYFKSIPVKVSLNEYIEISKDYSTPKSKTFINGILDRLLTESKANGTIVKTGRGLIE